MPFFNGLFYLQKNTNRKWGKGKCRKSNQNLKWENQKMAAGANSSGIIKN